MKKDRAVERDATVTAALRSEIAKERAMTAVPSA